MIEVTRIRTSSWDGSKYTRLTDRAHINPARILLITVEPDDAAELADEPIKDVTTIYADGDFRIQVEESLTEVIRAIALVQK